MMARLLTALQFLTLIPVKTRVRIPLSEAAPFFPVVGAFLGTITGTLLLVLQPYLGRSLASLVALSSLLILSGGLHEDGLADVADAIRAGRTREKMLLILKDSRVGTYGVLALLSVFLIRWQALERYRVHPTLGLIASLSLSRASMVALAGFSPALGEGLGADFVRHLSRPLMFSTVLLAMTIALLAGVATGLLMIGSSALAIVGARAYLLRRIGGVNGDCLGATCMAVETANLLILAWQPYT